MTTIDLSLLPAPDFVDVPDLDTLKAEIVADVVERYPHLQKHLLQDGHPDNKILEVVAYRESLVRQDVNDRARSIMLAFSSGPDLDHLAAFYGIQRILISEGDDTANPPVPAVWESDAELLERVQRAPLGFSLAGPEEAYRKRAIEADPDVKDAQAITPSPCEVAVYVLGRGSDGTPSAETVAAVETALTDKTARPMGDRVTVTPATVQTYTLDATLTVGTGPDASIVEVAAEAAAQKYADEQHGLKKPVKLGKLAQALWQEGVEDVDLAAPVADLVAADGTAHYLTAINLTVVQQ